MLRRNITIATMDHALELDDLLADLHHARKREDLGRLAFVAYCDVRRWARKVERLALAEEASRLITDSPHQSREAFLRQMDRLIDELETLREAASPASASIRLLAAAAG